jgi:hypothetical protein
LEDRNADIVSNVEELIVDVVEDQPYTMVWAADVEFEDAELLGDDVLAEVEDEEFIITEDIKDTTEGAVLPQLLNQLEVFSRP